MSARSSARRWPVRCDPKSGWPPTRSGTPPVPGSRTIPLLPGPGSPRIRKENGMDKWGERLTRWLTILIALYVVILIIDRVVL